MSKHFGMANTKFTDCRLHKETVVIYIYIYFYVINCAFVGYNKKQ